MAEFHGKTAEEVSEQMGLYPSAATELSQSLAPRQGYIPIVALDPIEGTRGVEWIGPFPNARGGSA